MNSVPASRSPPARMLRSSAGRGKRALTVHSHARSQRVSLRGVSRALPFLRRTDENDEEPLLSSPLLSSPPTPLCEHGDGGRGAKARLDHTSLPLCRLTAICCLGRRDESDVKRLLLSLRPPQLRYLTAGRLKVRAPRLLPDTHTIPLSITLSHSVTLSLLLTHTHARIHTRTHGHMLAQTDTPLFLIVALSA